MKVVRHHPWCDAYRTCMCPEVEVADEKQGPRMKPRAPFGPPPTGADPADARVKGGSRMDASTAHRGDPCVYCDQPHDAVDVGPCPGREKL